MGRKTVFQKRVIFKIFLLVQQVQSLSDHLEAKQCKFKFPVWAFSVKLGPDLGLKITKIWLFLRFLKSY